VFPLRDDNPTLHTSIATFLIIAINIAAWIFVQGIGFNPALTASVVHFGLIPGELLGTVEPGTRIALGQGYTFIITEGPRWSTAFTHMFMHGGWLHLIGNMWFLSVFGDNVEDAMGSVKFFIFYLLCGLAAGAAQTFAAPGSAIPMVGASGAIGGVMGAYALLFPRAPVHMLVFLGFFFTRIVVPAFFMLGYWFLLQFVGGFFSGAGDGGVAFWAHIGGFVMGIALVKIFCNTELLADCRLRRGQMNRMIQRYR
jgi:membrane associated rhomboid family serine protease